MRISGIAGKKHPTLKRGDAIELSPDGKIEAMASEVVSQKMSPAGYLYVPLSAEVQNEAKVIRGRKDIKDPEPDQYMGTAKVRYRPNKLDTDRVFPVKEATVKVHCKDVKNEIGVPDIELVDHSIL